MASSISFQGSLLRSPFLGHRDFSNANHKPCTLITEPSKFRLRPYAKFNLFEILGGRGLCNGEQGIQRELEKGIDVEQTSTTVSGHEEDSESTEATTGKIPEDGFEKELLGLTGGFPGGEKGLQKFIEENPPPKKQTRSSSATLMATKKKPMPPELPLLMPGMIAIVKNENSPYYMYCGIVQRITDGKAGVLFEGGNWDRLITFRLDELQRREKGPPGKNPKSAVLEAAFEKDSQQ